MHELFHGGQCLALHLIAAHHVHRLRRQANMPGNRNLSINDAADQVRPLLTAFDLHRLGAAFLDEARRVAHSLISAHMVRAVRHVGDQQGILHAPAHRPGVVQHLVRSDGQRVLVAEHGLGQRVADQHDVNTGLIHQPRSGVVVGRQAGDRFMTTFLLT